MTCRRLGAVVVLVWAATASGEPDSFLLGNGLGGSVTIPAGTNAPVNSYAVLTAAVTGPTTTISVSTTTGFAAQNLVLILQTTGITPVPASEGTNPIDLRTNPVGTYELARIQSVGSGALTFTRSLYRTFPASVTQVIKVPEYSALTIEAGASITAPAWDGAKGGVIAFLVSGALINNGSIDAWGVGFRGGARSANSAATLCTGIDEAAPRGAVKGEGIANTRYPTATGRGYIANGGGGGICLNSGGGGGGGAGAGGRGGTGASASLGGSGGAYLTYDAFDHLLLGGGGGGGQQNDTAGSSGASGGGIVFIRAASYAGDGDITVSGDWAANAGNDGAGGGGAGGTLVIRLAGTATCAAGLLAATGGRGGGVTVTGQAPGGGGGGGSLFRQASSWGSNCFTYLNGEASGLDPGSFANGAADGAPGVEVPDTVAFAAVTAPSVSVTSPTNDSTPTISGSTSAPSVKVHLFIDGNFRAERTSSTGSTFTYTPATALSDGSHPIFGQAERKGVYSPPGASATVVVDTLVPDTEILTGPAANSNQTSVTLTFGKLEAPSTSTVTLECALDGASPYTFSDCSSGTRVYSGITEGAHTVRVRARDAAGNIDPSPAAHSWTADFTKPNTTSPTGPPALTNQRSWSFTLNSSETGSTFRCRLDGAASYTSCTSPYVTPSLSDGAHVLLVQAVDPAGNPDDVTPYRADWTVDATGPVTTLNSAPFAFENTPTFSFAFSSNEGGSFECRLDTPTFSPCTSPVEVDLADGSHTFAVRAVDPATNADSTPESVTWTIDTVEPETVIFAGPSVTSNLVNPTFEFSSPEPNVTFFCSSENDAFTPCTTPLTLTGLAVGLHRFRVYARDQATNTDSSPAERIWELVIDADRDGLTDEDELEAGTDPGRPDTDFDGLSDFAEVAGGGSDALDGDTDDDGVLDGMEDTSSNGVRESNETDPRVADTDGDGLSDGVERGVATAPSSDTNPAVFVADAQPSTRTNPLLVDTDGDGLDDGVEDANRDGARGTTENDPVLADTDGDALPDGAERSAANATDPLDPDCDDDGLPDGAEDLDGDGTVGPEETNPNDADSDNGGVVDGVERDGGSNPLDGEDDYGIRGGGCAAAGHGSSWAFAALSLLGLIGAKRRSRRFMSRSEEVAP